MMNDEQLRQKLDGILALTMTTAGLAPQGFDQILALIHEERKAAVDGAFQKLDQIIEETIPRVRELKSQLDALRSHDA